MTDFPQTITVVDKRIYGETLFHIFAQDEIYNNTYMNRIILDFKNLLNFTHFDKFHHDYSNTITTQLEYKGVQRKVCFTYALNFLINILKRLYKRTLTEKILK